MIGRTPLLEALYSRIAHMTTANEYYHDWNDQKSIGNGSWIRTTASLHIAFGEEAAAEDVPTAQNRYALELPVMITGLKYKKKEPEDTDDSALNEIQYDLDIEKSKVIDDIRKAFFHSFSALCTAGGKSIHYVQELEVSDELRDAFEVEATLEFRIKFEADGDIN